jgi:hypothetical protein
VKGYQPLLFNDSIREKEQADAGGEVSHTGNGNGAASHVSSAGG